jgi:hypothetical protein
MGLTVRAKALFIGAVIFVAGIAAAAAPPGRYIVVPETVVDTKTGLTWQRSVSPTTHTQSSAPAYCTNLQLAGSNDWRLPTLRELLTTVDVREINPTIDTTVFLDTPFSLWSSTAVQGTTLTWRVDFLNGHSDFASVQSDLRVRCVRESVTP